MLHAACALAIQLDLCLCPSEALEIRRADIADTAFTSGAVVVIARAAPDTREGSKTGL